MRDGHLFMPTMTWRTVTPEHPDWDEMTTPSHTGVLSEIFRTRYAVARSIHPTHSAAGLGPGRTHALSRHHVDDTPVSANSPYGLLREYETYVFMVGVDWRRAPPSICRRSRSRWIFMFARRNTGRIYPCRDRHGTVITSRRGAIGGSIAISIGSHRRSSAQGQLGQDDRGLPLYDRLAARPLARGLCRPIDNPRATLSVESTARAGRRV